MRAFIALELPLSVKENLSKVISNMSMKMDGVKWVNNAGLHITLKFLGEVEETLVGRIREGLSYLGEKYPPFTLALDCIDAFPDKKRARVIVVKLKNRVDIAINIFKDIENNLEKYSFEKEKRVFTPHITLGRRKTPAPLLEKTIAKLDELEFPVDTLVMFKSTLTNKGAIYDPIWKIKLGGIIQ
ncbi:MAG TPA: RNA 2',3'-cyclic phosphodiesterase [Syntrophorhabdaceae bacterium]|nr:RNA 2',3'-cyclic phosphodiesterase [Syntrophorhabdaceae bacterium]